MLLTHKAMPFKGTGIGMQKQDTSQAFTIQF